MKKSERKKFSELNGGSTFRHKRYRELSIKLARSLHTLPTDLIYDTENNKHGVYRIRDDGTKERIKPKEALEILATALKFSVPAITVKSGCGLEFGRGWDDAVIIPC